MIGGVLAIQEAIAKALLVDLDAWRRAQEGTNLAPLVANEALLDAYETDVAPLLAATRATLGISPDPVEAYHELCRNEHRASERRAAIQRLVSRHVAGLLAPKEG